MMTCKRLLVVFLKSVMLIVASGLLLLTNDATAERVGPTLVGNTCVNGPKTYFPDDWFPSFPSCATAATCPSPLPNYIHKVTSNWMCTELPVENTAKTSGKIDEGVTGVTAGIEILYRRIVGRSDSFVDCTGALPALILDNTSTACNTPPPPAACMQSDPSMGYWDYINQKNDCESQLNFGWRDDTVHAPKLAVADWIRIRANHCKSAP